MPLPFTPRHHQALALDALADAEAAVHRRSWVVMPPGAGKTLVGLAHAHRFDDPVVVLCPNTAIQAQWVAAQAEYFPGRSVGTDRDLSAEVTVLTYQSIATFDVDGADDSERAPDDPASLIGSLHPNGQRLIAALHDLGELTLVLDECHHLLQVWGRLLDEVLAELPDARVLGLTATPAESLTAAEAALTARLFGEVVHQSTIPAAVRRGELAPFAELLWLTTPTAAETDWLAEQSVRFEELITRLCDPTFGPTGFLAWLDSALICPIDTQLTWAELERDSPTLTDAALRLHHRGLLGLPAGARLAERHRHDPGTDDWIVLINHWVRHHLQPVADSDATDTADDTAEATRTLIELRERLPALGLQLTGRGIRRTTSPVDRVLSRSAAKSEALTQIARGEHAELGRDLRLLVVCDHERATATVPSSLEGVLDRQSGSARLALTRLRDELPELAPVLMTARTVAGDEDTLTRLAEFCRAAEPDLDLAPVRDEEDDLLVLQANPGSGRWHSRRWVPLVTRFFEQGNSRALVGTRGLLGEGWDARSVTTLVDLTSATTATSVVQTRGRALRIDPRRPDKVATNWSVTCIADGHPDGAVDWDRLVRKHDGFFATDRSGAIVDGVAHLSDDLSPFAPPTPDLVVGLNSQMLQRVADRAEIATDWRVGDAYHDEIVPVLRVLPEPEPTTGSEITGPERLPALRIGDTAALWRPSAWLAVPLASGALVTPALGLAGASVTRVVTTALLTVLAMIAVQLGITARRGRARYLTRGERPTVSALADAVAEAMRNADGVVGTAAVDIDADGTHRCRLDSDDSQARQRFGESLDELLAPMGSPRYVISRPTTGPEASLVDGLLAALGRVRPTGEVWHPVPTDFGRNRARAEIFARAFDAHVGGSRIEYAGSPEGQAIVQTHRGLDPFAATTVTRLHWR